MSDRSTPIVGRLVIVFAILASTGAAAHGQAIRWLSGATEVTAQSPAETRTAIDALAARAADHRVVVQFDRAIERIERVALAAAGVELLSSVGHHAYFASLAVGGVDSGAAVAAAPIRAVVAIARPWKVHPRVTNAIIANDPPNWVVGGDDENGTTLVGLYVAFHRDVDLGVAAADVATAHGAIVRSRLESVNSLVITLPISNIDGLAAEDTVQWIEWPLPQFEVVNDSNRIITQANEAQAPPYNLDGTGITVLVYDGGTARASHDDFGGRLTVRDGSGMGDHPTHVSGTVGGDGTASAGQWAGMAPNVTIESYGFEWSFLPFFFADPGDIEDDYDEAINVFGAEIANNSIGTNTCGNGFDCEITGDYGVASSLIDAIVAGSLGEPMRIVWANGNERSCGGCTNQGGADSQGYHSTAPPACAKNQISVGALNSNDDSMTGFSSWGPCDDGRLRPDVSAPGCQSDGDGAVRSTSSAGNTAYSNKCGTSMASPTVCGLSALLLGDHKTQFPGEPLPRNSTLKALLAHAAVDLGNPGPDYAFGYGSVRIKDSIDVMRAENFFEKEVAQGEVLSALVLVSEGDTEVKVTISWDDVAGTPNIQDALINDLDLRLISPSQQVFFPWTLNPSEPGDPAVQTQPDHRNNTEQVFVGNPEVGAWRIEIEGFDVPDGPQTVSIVGTPALVNCSSSGVILMNAVLLGCSSIAEIQVIDCDLNTDDNKIETIEVNIASETSPAGETVVLTEIDAATANFLGTIQLSTEDVEGMLQVSPNDTVTATYIDADDGVGGENVPVVFTATVDCDGPVITNVHVISVGATTATIGFDTDEPAVGQVNYGLACALLFGLAQEENATTSHVVELTALLFDSQYFFSVTAVDNQSNPSTDDNEGNCHTFTTPNVVFDFPFDANPGWSTEGQWGFGQPNGQGKPPDPTGGHTGNNVYGYNLGGDYPNNLPANYLTTTAIDCTGLLDVSLSFWRWLGVESSANSDEASIEVSADGSNWIPVWNATDTGEDVLDESWTLQEFNVAPVADNQGTVFFRWGMGPTDGDTTFAGWNIDDVQIIANDGPIAIGVPQGVPDVLLPGESAQVTVRIVEGNENLIADTGMLHYRTGGGEFFNVPLMTLFEDFYEATLPAANCDETLEFFFSAEGDQSGVVTLPAGAPGETFAVAIGELVIVADHDFETDKGWTSGAPGDNATTGIWVRVDPVGTEAQPENDHTPDPGNQCWVTGQGVPEGGQGVNDVDDGHTTLVSPILDASNGFETISYWRWFSNDTGAGANTDVFVVDISNNAGQTWTNVETVGPSGPETSGEWFLHEVTVSDFVAPTSEVQLRFIATDDSPGSIVEAGVDDFLMERFICEPVVPGDFDGNGVVDLADVAVFVDCIGGPNQAPSPTAPVTAQECLDVFDFDNDTDIDMKDAGAFFTNFGDGNP